MIPAYGPAETESQSEPLIYDILHRGLSDDYTVIHSLPWLSSAAKEIDDRFVAPTGQIDFLIIHPVLGMLAIEVKGGKYRIEGSAFVLIKGNKRVGVLKQTQDNSHGLARWLGGKNSIYLRIGYALCFPDSQFPAHMLPPGLVDPCGITFEAITLGLSDLPRLAARVTEIMQYWKEALRNPDLGRSRADELIAALCPNFDGTPSWAERIVFDNHFWLRLTDEQSQVVNGILVSERSIVTGWPGTGKTLIGIEAVRRIKGSGARVLVVTFNALLADHLTEQLSESNCDVFTWHKLCFQARARLELPAPAEEWFSDECAEDLTTAIGKGLLSSYDVLLLDEAQALRPGWCAVLVNWFSSKRIIAFCDETQVFPFEKEPTSLTMLSDLLGGIQPSYLTIVMRMPRAVTDRLLEVKPSAYQLSSPRKSDDETVRELVVDDLTSCIEIVMGDLFERGVEETDIVVLTRFQDVPCEVRNFVSEHPGIRIEMVSRFRGMEAPVILIVWADEFSDTELFSAYSRATTLCLALFSAERLIKTHKGAFLPSVIAKSENHGILQRLRHRISTSNLLSAHSMDRIEGVNSVDIWWSRTWNCWMVQCDRNNSLSLWVDFLVFRYPWPVLYWEENSRRTLYMARRAPESGDISFLETNLRHCSSCGELTPSNYMPQKCHVCAGEVGSREHVLMRGQVRELVEYDVALRSVIQSPNTEEFEKALHELPFVLAVAAAGEYARRQTPDSPVSMTPYSSSGSDFYRWAVAFVGAIILLREEGLILELAAVASTTYRPELAEWGADQRKWYQFVALALEFHTRSGHLIRVQKGRYRITSHETGERDDVVRT
jgi:hypothetical protein